MTTEMSERLPRVSRRQALYVQPGTFRKRLLNHSTRAASGQCRPTSPRQRIWVRACLLQASHPPGASWDWLEWLLPSGTVSAIVSTRICQIVIAFWALPRKCAARLAPLELFTISFTATKFTRWYDSSRNSLSNCSRCFKYLSPYHSTALVTGRQICRTT
jgi:hypothetical protein